MQGPMLLALRCPRCPLYLRDSLRSRRDTRHGWQVAPSVGQRRCLTSA